MTSPTDKKEFRKQMLAKRRALDSEKINELSQGIAERLFAAKEYREARIMLCFVSTEIEVNTRPIIKKALADGKRVAVPLCIKGSCELSFRYITGTNDLAEGAFGILEPLSHCEECTGFDGALCVVPSLCCDRRGHRMGYGRGYYDRFLAGFGGTSCGVIFGEFLLDRIPTEPTDMPLDMMITESDTYRSITP